MTREERLRRALADTGMEDQAPALAGLPAGQVTVIVAAIKASHRAGREHEREVRRQRKADASKHDHFREDIVPRNLRLVGKQGERAGSGDLDMLAGLAQLRRLADGLIGRGVAGCRARGIPDTAIAEALSVTKQAVSKRWQRSTEVDPETPEMAEPS